MENFRSRVFCSVLYPDDESHVKALEKIKEMYDCAYILHDKDVKEDAPEDFKKKHWHVVYRIGNNAKWRSAVAKEIGVAENYIEDCKNIDKALQYLVHYNNPEKHAYPVTDVKGNLSQRLIEKINSENKTEGEKVIELIDYIESSDDTISVTTFARYCAEGGKWDVYRRAGSIFTSMLNEHNDKIYIKRYGELKKHHEAEVAKERKKMLAARHKEEWQNAQTQYVEFGDIADMQ